MLHCYGDSSKRTEGLKGLFVWGLFYSPCVRAGSLQAQSTETHISSAYVTVTVVSGVVSSFVLAML